MAAAFAVRFLVFVEEQKVPAEEEIDEHDRTDADARHALIRDRDEPIVPADDAHVRACCWVPRDELAAILTVRVVREPLLRYLADPAQRYTGYLDAGITIAFGD